jgi:hypothetical protein
MKLLTNRFLTLVAVSSAIAANVVAICNWASPTFDNCNNCMGYLCAIGCYLTYLGPTQNVCYTSGHDCCRCEYFYGTCEGFPWCGGATGSLSATRHWQQYSHCSSTTGKCNPVPE